MTSLQAFEIREAHRGYQLKEDAIHIFLNFEKVVVARSKTEAVSTLDKLIQNCPLEAKKDFEDFKDILYGLLI